MVRQDTNTSTSLFPWQVKKRWCGFVGGACISSSSSSFLPLLARQYLLSARSWGEEPLVKKLCPPCATARRPSLMTPRQMEGSFTARMRKRCGTWRRRWLPALCRTPPARSPPPEASCGRCYDDKHGRSEKCCQNSSSEDFWKHRTHVRDALRLQTQKSFPHEQQFGGEVWYTVNPHHEISNHLTHVTKKWDREKQLPNTSYGATHEKYWQLFSVVVPPVPLIHAVRCFSYHIRCFTEEQTTRGNIYGSVHRPADFRPACPRLWSKPWTLATFLSDTCHASRHALTATRRLTTHEASGAKIITNSSSWQDGDCSKSSLWNPMGFSAAACVFVMPQS